MILCNFTVQLALMPSTNPFQGRRERVAGREEERERERLHRVRAMKSCSHIVFISNFFDKEKKFVRFYRTLWSMVSREY